MCHKGPREWELRGGRSEEGREGENVIKGKGLKTDNRENSKKGGAKGPHTVLGHYMFTSLL